MEAFLQLVGSNGKEGLIAGIFVLVVVFLANRSGVVIGGSQKRIANIVLSICLAGLSLLDPNMNDAIQAAIASVGSAVAFHFLEWLVSLKAGSKKE